MHDLRAFVLKFHFLFGVTALQKNIHMRQDIERDRMRIDVRRRMSILRGGGYLFLEFVDRALAASRNRLIAGRKYAFHAKRAMQRINRHQRDGGRAIWICNHAAMLFHVIGIDFRNH